MTIPLSPYFNAIKHLDAAEGTEHTLRGALENLLNAIAADENPNVTVIHEPKRDKTKLGAPDFKIKLHEAILGYLETKPIGDNLDTVLQSAQIAKYKRLSGNLILTDYLEWIWLRDGEIIQRETLCYPSDAGNRRARLDPGKAEKVAKLIAGFLSVPPAKLGNTNTLSRALAVRCHDLRDFLLEELERQEKEHQEERLYGLYIVFKKEVFQELTLKEFADAFAQTLGYGLFLFGLPASMKLQLKPEEIIIESASKEQIRRELKELHDIHEESLFPDFVGFAYTQRHDAPYDTPSAEEYISHGIKAAQRGQYPEAIEDFSKAIELRQDYPGAYYFRGLTYGRQGEHKRAMEDLTKAIELDSNYPDAHYFCGIAYLHLKEWEKAKEFLTAARNMGMDLTEDSEGIAGLEQAIGVLLPKDIEAMLTRRVWRRPRL